MTIDLIPTRRAIFQNAWVVDDVEAACHKWATELGIGPFFVNEYRGVFDEVSYHGQPDKLEMIVALAQAGSVQIELIQPLVDRCAYRDSVPEGTGFHHMCVWTHDFERDHQYFTSRGYHAANIGRVGEVQFGYYDTRSVMGYMMEIVTHNPGTVAKFEEISAAAQNWDGRDPIRS